MSSYAKRIWNEFFVEGEDIIVKNDILTWPNLATLLGIVGVGFYVYQFTANVYMHLIPVTVFLIVLSDMLDGLLARRLDQHTRFGKFIDPLRDSLFFVAIMFNIVIAVDMDTITGPFAIVVVMSMMIVVQNILCSKLGVAVHTIKKLRQTVNVIAASIFVTQTYWLTTEYVSVLNLVYAIILTSIVSFIWVAVRMDDQVSKQET